MGPLRSTRPGIPRASSAEWAPSLGGIARRAGGTRNVPTFYPVGKSATDAAVQFDYAFASRRFHEGVKVRALSEVDEWGSSDHCRLLIDVDTG